MLLTLAGTVFLLFLAYLSVQTGKNAILDRQRLCREQWDTIHNLSAAKHRLLEKLQEPNLPVVPEELIHEVPATGPLAQFLEHCDSLAWQLTRDEHNPPNPPVLKEYIRYSHEIQAAVFRYNDLVRESNHFMKEFPNNFYSSLFSIPSMPDFQENNIYLSNIELYLHNY
ncbi:MAG: hypothetical protein ACP5D1_03550 [Bacteroidales bacterium]